MRGGDRDRLTGGAELPLLVAAVMLGLVLAANPGRYGIAGAILGAAIAGGGTWACQHRFRRRGAPAGPARQTTDEGDSIP